MRLKCYINKRVLVQPVSFLRTGGMKPQEKEKLIETKVTNFTRVKRSLPTFKVSRFEEAKVSSIEMDEISSNDYEEVSGYEDDISRFSLFGGFLTRLNHDFHFIFVLIAFLLLLFAGLFSGLLIIQYFGTRQEEELTYIHQNGTSSLQLDIFSG